LGGERGQGLGVLDLSSAALIAGGRSASNRVWASARRPA
jgi:hypothetical protein